ncbi:MAG TPA: hypothetical protein VHN58_12585 [Croceicoccus sp.]|nr:hypothetical protein [Croceicoccus sp.]
MEKISNAVSHMTAGLAAIALTFAAIAVTVAPVQPVAPLTFQQEMSA